MHGLDEGPDLLADVASTCGQVSIYATRCQIRFWAKRRPLAISVAAWLLYVALLYLRTVP
jgi:hypothetical protein